MTYLRSGRRRDICAILYDSDGHRAQALKTELEQKYDTRLKPKTFYGAIDSLVDAGHLEQRTDGIHDVYALTDDGATALEAHYDWLSTQLEPTEADTSE